MNTLFEAGLLNSGATIAARLLGEFGPDCWLTNEPIGELARWWEYRPGTGRLWPRQVVKVNDGPFPYGLEVENP